MLFKQKNLDITKVNWKQKYTELNTPFYFFVTTEM